MNFQSIKTKFLLHLKEITPSFDTGVMSLDSSDESIFSHAQEFKEFIKQEYNITDSSLMSMSINDIMEKDIVDGKLVEAGETEANQEEQTQQAQEASQEETQAVQQLTLETAQAEEQTEETTPETIEQGQEATEQVSEPPQEETQTDQTEAQDEENTLIADIIGGLFESEDLKNGVDADKSGDINEEEFNDFLNYIKTLDGNEDNVSLDDLFSLIDSLSEGTFKMPEPESETPTETPTDTPTETPTDAPTETPTDTPTDTSTETPTDAPTETPTDTPTDTPQSTDTPASSHTPSSGGNYDSGSNYDSGGNHDSGGSYDSSSPSSDSGNNTTPTPDNTQKSYKDMTEEELNQEYQNENKELEVNKAAMQSAADGSHPDLAESKEAMDKAYEEYKNALNPELQQQLDEITSQIAQTEAQIAEMELQVTEQVLAVSEAETAYNDANTTYESYKNTVDELNSKKSDSSLTDEQKSELNSKISEATSKRDAAKADIDAKKAAWDAAQTKLDQLQAELDILNGAEGLEKLNSEKTALEEKIKTECPDAQTLMNTYNEAKAAYDAKKDEIKQQALTDIGNSQTKINEINSAKNNLKDQKDIEDNYKFASSGKLFDENTKLTTDFVKDGNMNYLVIAPDNVDPNEELPVLMYLHGSGQCGAGEKGLKQTYCPAGFMKNWNLKNFRGYIICPVLPKSKDSWQGKDGKLRTLLDNFSQTHKINKNKIALTGGSLGGAGAVYMATHMKDVFCRTAALSAYGSGCDPEELNADGKVRIRGYYGNHDASGSISYMKGKHGFKDEHITVVKGSHCDVPKSAFSQDTDGDGCSDLIQWLFEDY